MAVYFVQEVDAGGMWIVDDKPIKIGYSNSLGSRLQGLQTGSYLPLAVKAVIPWGDQQLESSLHHHFRYHKINGEWFEIDGDLNRFLSCCVLSGAGEAEVRNFLSIPTDREVYHNLVSAVEEYEKHTGCEIEVCRVPRKTLKYSRYGYFKSWLWFRYMDFKYWLKYGCKEVVITIEEL